MKSERLYIKHTVDGKETLFPSAKEYVSVSKFTYSAKRMGGAPTIEATFYHDKPLDDEWKHDEYVEFRGERYYVTSTPSSSKDNTNHLYKHEITFTSRREILDNTLFFDAVSDNEDVLASDKYRSNLTKFTFGGNIHEFVARINDSMAYSGLDGYKVVIDDGYGTDEVKEVSFDDQYITNVLQLIKTTYELDFYWVGKTCHVGKVENDLSREGQYGSKYVCRYGRNDALLSIGKENTNEKIIDVITGYGSSDNIPYYYPNEGEYGLCTFNVENTEKSNVEIDLKKMYLRGDPIGKTYTFCKVDEKLFSGTEDVNYHEEMAGAPDEGGGRYPGSWDFYVVLECKANFRLDFSKLKLTTEFEQVNNNNIQVWFDTGITMSHNGKEETINELNDKYVCSEDGVYTLHCHVDYEFYGEPPKDNSTSYAVAKASLVGTVKITYEGNSILWFVSSDDFFEYKEGCISFDDLSKAPAAVCGYTWENGKFRPSDIQDDGKATKISITGRKYIQPCQYLMPSIYRETAGKERFYKAEDNKYKKPDGSGLYYTFDNVYKDGNPHQASVSFEDIKPTIRGIRNDVIQSDGLGQLFGEIADVAFDAKDNDEKDESGNYIHSYFYVKLHKFSGEYGFDLFANALASENAKIEMIECQGCPACSFDIMAQPSADKSKMYNPVCVDEAGNLKRVVNSGAPKEADDYILNANDAYADKLNQDSRTKELWIALKKETSTLGIVMPNVAMGFKPKAGDKFVITGINPPIQLVTSAEKRLEEALIQHMSENNKDKFNYSIKFSRIFLQENPEFADKLNENSKLTIEYNGKQAEVFVSDYTVKMDDNILAEVTVSLVLSLEATQGDIKNIVDSVKGETIKSLGVLGGSGGVNMALLEKSYLSKVHDDSTTHKVSFGAVETEGNAIFKGSTVISNDGTFIEGMTGRGTKITDGTGEMDSLVLRRSLEVPYLDYNRITVNVGNQWRAPGGGIIKSARANPVNTKTGTCTLKLEEKEIGKIAVGDICMGIFHSLKPSENAKENTDDNKGNFKFAGFYTVYFRITAIRDYTDKESGTTYINGEFDYQLRSGYSIHPSSSMEFVCYGSFTDATRQSSRYSTLTYERFLSNVNTWEFTANNVRMQIGDLSNFRPVDDASIDFEGYSVYCDSIYMSGYLKQLAEMGESEPYTYTTDNIADTLPLDATGKLKQPIVSTDSSGNKSWLLHTSLQVRKGQTLLTAVADEGGTPSAGQFALSLNPVGCTAHADHSTIYVDTVDYENRATAYVEATMDCEGNAALTHVFTIKVVRDGDKGQDGKNGKDGATHGTRRQYAISAYSEVLKIGDSPLPDVTSWGDTPPTPTTDKPYLWVRLTDWTKTSDDTPAVYGTPVYVRMTGERGPQGERGEDGLDGRDGKSWTLRGTAAGHVANVAALPAVALNGAIYLIDTGASGTPVAMKMMAGGWASLTVQENDAYIYEGDLYMATTTAWVKIGHIQGEKGEKGDQGLQGEPGANGRTSRIYQTLTDGQQYYDGSTITADGFCYLDFFAEPNDTAASGWNIYQCKASYIFHKDTHQQPSKDSMHWKQVAVNADSAFFTFLLARNARIDFLEGNAISVRKKHSTEAYAGMGGDFPFWAGSKTPYPDASGLSGSTYTFAVDEAGNLFASSAYLTGTINATGGTIGGFTIQSDSMVSGDARGTGITITPSKIEARNRMYENGAAIIDTDSNITAAFATGTYEGVFWPCALQLTGKDNASYQGTALDIIKGITRGIRPEVALLKGKVSLLNTTQTTYKPQQTGTGRIDIENGANGYLRSGAVLVFPSGATVVLPPNPVNGDNYILLPFSQGSSVTIGANGQRIICDGKDTGTDGVSAGNALIFIIYLGEKDNGGCWIAKTLS